MTTSTLIPYFVTPTFFGTATPQINPNAVTVLQKEFCHDVLVMEFWADDVEADSYVSGMPVQVTFGRSYSTQSFFGYVNHPERSSQTSTTASLMEKNSTTIYCVGASWLMKQTDSVSWTNVTASQAVTQIAQKFGLVADVVPHSQIWPTLQMAGKSYWQFCMDLAKRIGYTLYCNGVKLSFKPRNTNPLTLTEYVRTYDYSSDPLLLPKFMPTLGVTNPTGGEYVNRVMANVDPVTNNVIVSTMSGATTPTVLGSTVEMPIFTKTVHSTAASQSEANARLVGQARANQMYLTAKATSVGDSGIHQGSLIYVKNANGSQNGLWFVTEAKHCFSNKTYSLELCLGRDSMGDTTFMSVPPATISAPAATLQGGTWIAVP